MPASPHTEYRPLCERCDEAFSERAAIREYDGGYTRAQAEWLALDDVRQYLCACWGKAAIP